MLQVTGSKGVTNGIARRRHVRENASRDGPVRRQFRKPRPPTIRFSKRLSCQGRHLLRGRQRPLAPTCTPTWLSGKQAVFSEITTDSVCRRNRAPRSDKLKRR